MTKKQFFGFLGILMLVLLTLACKSQPPETEPESLVAPPETTAPVEEVSQALLNSLNDARSRAEAARQEAQSVNGPVYFPQEWEQADGSFTRTGSSVNTGNARSVQDAIASYNSLTTAFEDIVRRSLPLFAEAKQEEVFIARQAAIDAGAFEFSPGRFYIADEKGEEVSRRIEAEDYRDAIDAAEVALNYYTSLKLGADAYMLRGAILDDDLAHYDQRNFDLAEESGLKALNAYDDGDIAAVMVVVEEALNRYTQVWKTAWRSIASERRDIASVERRAALNVKANVAVKDEYESAESIYSQAGTKFQSEEFEDAAELYTRSSSLFTAAWENAEYKRQIADYAIRAAEQKVAESDQTAREAELILEEGEEE
ncbi:MAG: hypothetical protein LBH73_06980 [Spirochaetaceae bacterium]|jgi:hypothetical protein|nr:hypothetical protein [Spirochaetaceae bacterium]